MTEQEIQDGNREILVFLGYVPTPSKIYSYRHKNTGVCMFDSQINYHKSYDSLIPVVREIKGINFVTHPDLVNKNEWPELYLIQGRINELSITSDIDGVWSEVVTFCKLYNQIKKK